jgi:hypothetical protein
VPDDDERTPVDTPRAKPSSLSVSTAELVLTQLAVRLSLPALLPDNLDAEARSDAADIVLVHCQVLASRGIATVRAERDDVTKERDRLRVLLDSTQRELNQARNQLRGDG